MTQLNSLDRLLNRPRGRASVTLAYDPDQAAALSDARARRLMSGADEALDAEIAAMEAALVTVTFAMQSIGVAAVDAIIEANRDPKGDGVSAGFLSALLAAVCQTITVSDAPDEPITDLAAEVMAKVVDRLTLADQEKLSTAALSVDRRSSAIESV